MGDDVAMVDVSGLTLGEIEGDDSVLGLALKRLEAEKLESGDPTAFHTDHTDSHGSSPW